MAAPLASADHVPARVKSEEELVLYHSWITLTRELMEMQARNPAIMKVESAGKSILGLDLWAVRLAADGAIPVERRERVYVDGGIHANEQLGMELAFLYVKYLVNGYGSDDNATWILENRDTLVVPMVNPDGNVRDARQNTRLVDLNRNFPYGWGGPGSGSMIGGATYRGPSAASEPETQAIIKTIVAFDPDYSQSYHTGITMLLHPWGGNDTAVPDRAVYDRICEEFRTIDGSDKFPCGDVFTTIYPATGGTVDFAYAATGAISWTYEVDDQQTIPFSLEPLDSRLRVPFEAQMQAFRNVHKYGNHPVLANLARTGAGALSFDVLNDGYVATNRTDIRILAPDGQVIHTQSLGRIEPGQAVAVSASIPTGTERVTIEADYDKNLFMPRPRVRSLELALADFSITAEGGLLLAAASDGSLTPAGTPEVRIPAPPAVLGTLIMALAAILIGRRARG